MPQIARDAQRLKKQERTAFAREQLRAQVAHFPDVLLLPLSPRMKCAALLVDRCKVMDSKRCGAGGHPPTHPPGPFRTGRGPALPRGAQSRAVWRVAGTTVAGVCQCRREWVPHHCHLQGR